MRSRSKQGVHAGLTVLGLAGFAGVVVTAPNATRALNMAIEPALEHMDISEKERIFRILKRQGLVHITKEDDAHFRLTITPAGMYRLQDHLLETLEVKPMRKWDGRWRLVCYDIPAGKNKERMELSYHLKRMGFSMVQKSMWVHPHECIEIVRELTDALNLTRYVTVLEVVRLDELTTRRLLKRYENTVRI